jgi:hypothetical protein
MNRRPCILGVDPDKKGAMTLLDSEGKYIECIDTPTLSKGRFYFESEIDDIIKGLKFAHVDIVAFIEDTLALPDQSCTSAKVTHYGLGLWAMVMTANGIYYEIVDPQDWQEPVFNGLPRKGNAKDKAMYACGVTFPDICLINHRSGKQTMQGRADSACIALYGYKTWYEIRAKRNER